MSKSKPVIVAVSGYFNPLHVGHLEMIEKSRKLGDKLVAIVNNDYQVKLKGSVPFMSQADRLKIVSALKYVDKVFLSIDRDATVCKSLAKVRPNIFANGGDRKSLNDVPEFGICSKLGIKMVDGLGKKIRASSKLIAEAAAKKAKLCSK
jgi:D-beta-D-heptose 7-phosphate kinase/D-beta-D-heptose 1-phosphate adenosyltransferase